MRSLMTGLAADQTSLPADILAAPRRPRAHRSVPERVSVLIPTLDAGPEFERTLESISAQEGLGGLEVVVVDSGSSDETVSLASASGARVHGIPPTEFNHGRVRNQLAEMATGDMLLMTVQDATLVGKHTLRDLVLALKNDSRLAAVSAKQMARPDADLYSKFLCWRRNETLPSDSGVPTESLTRSACLVEDVCATIRRSAWEALRFRELPFAEDIDFGVRAYDAGWRTAFSDHAAVWHHHDRDAAYVLARGAVHRHTVADLLHHVERIPEAQPGLDALAAGMPAALGQLEAAISQAGGERESVLLAPYLAAVANGLRRNPRPLPPTGELGSVSALFDDRWEDGARAAGNEAACAELRRTVLYALKFPWLRHYALAHAEPVACEAAHAFVARCAASNLGEVVGDAMRDAPDTALAQRVTAAARLTPVRGSNEQSAASLAQ